MHPDRFPYLEVLTMETEPALIAAAVVAILSLAVHFGLDLGDGWEELVQTAILAVGALFTRSKVSPVKE